MIKRSVTFCPAASFAARFVIAGFAAFAANSLAAKDVDFKREIRPILEVNCLVCHGAEKPKGGLRLLTKAQALKGGENAPALVDHDAAKSPLYTSTALAADQDAAMPPKGDRLTLEQQSALKLWIEQGAPWPEDLQLVQRKRVDFVRDIQPIFEFHCVGCHREGHAEGDLRMDASAEFFGHKAIVPGDALASKVYTSTVLPADHDDLMPPKKKNGPISKEKTDLLREWIDQGASWPAGVKLIARKAEEAGPANEGAIIAALHRAIVEKLDVTQASEMKAYSQELPWGGIQFELVPIPAGKFLMGSPESEAKRNPDEGPQHEVAIEPFWMAKTEVTWDEYEQFMYKEIEFAAVESDKPNPYVNATADAVARPTKPYVEMSFGMGKGGYPAISMTHFAAMTYCKWLSAKTGRFYRLPSEAEWEYACRAGTTTKYSFGDDATKLGEYAWYFSNADSKYQKVATKKPNPWGLYDMHGNVAEWVLDAYVTNYSNAVLPFVPGVTEYPHVARGGSWDDDPMLLRSAVRRASDKSWKMRDPQLPKSRWYLTDAQFLGFRVVRPLKVPPVDELGRYWTSFTPVKK